MRRALVASVFIGMFAPATAFAEGAAVDKATEQEKKEALGKYEQGNTLYDKSEYSRALEAFRASWEIVASPNSRLMIARALSRLGRAREAYTEYDRTAADAEKAVAISDDYKKTAAVARDEQSKERKKIALIKVNLTKAPEESTVTIGNRSIPREEWSAPIAVDPGHVTLSLTDPEGHKTERSLDVEAGDRASVDLTLFVDKPPPPVIEHSSAQPQAPVKEKPPDPGAKTRRTLAYVAGGVGAAGFLTFGVLLVVDEPSLRDVRTGGLVIGVLGVAAGAVLYVSSAGATGTGRAPARRTYVGIGPRSAAIGMEW
jgi:hypothetical protein